MTIFVPRSDVILVIISPYDYVNSPEKLADILLFSVWSKGRAPFEAKAEAFQAYSFFSRVFPRDWECSKRDPLRS